MSTTNYREMRARVARNGHAIRYSGNRKRGWGWQCECGEGSGNIPWAERFERTWSAHDHLDEMGKKMDEGDEK